MAFGCHPVDVTIMAYSEGACRIYEIHSTIRCRGKTPPTLRASGSFRIVTHHVDFDCA